MDLGGKRIPAGQDPTADGSHDGDARHDDKTADHGVFDHHGTVFVLDQIDQYIAQRSHGVDSIRVKVLKGIREKFPLALVPLIGPASRARNVPHGREMTNQNLYCIGAPAMAIPTRACSAAEGSPRWS